MDLLIASGNPGKQREYRQLLVDAPVKLIMPQEVGLADLEIDENGDSLAANAHIKARAYAEASGLPVLADDTGLFVDALDGAPGIYAARFGGPGLTMPERRARLLAALGAKSRAAQFKCVIVLLLPDGQAHSVEGVCEGRIAEREQTGAAGFGYDAIFIPDGHDRPWSQVAMDAKNRISHRGRAARQIIPILEQLAGGARPPR